MKARNSKNKKSMISTRRDGVLANLPRSITTQPSVTFTMRFVRSDAVLSTEFLNVASLLSVLMCQSVTASTGTLRIFEAVRINRIAVHGMFLSGGTNTSDRCNVTLPGGEYGRSQQHEILCLPEVPGKCVLIPPKDSTLGFWHQQGVDETLSLLSISQAGAGWVIDINLTGVISNSSFSNGSLTCSNVAAGLYGGYMDATNAAGTAAGTKVWPCVGYTALAIVSIP